MIGQLNARRTGQLALTCLLALMLALLSHSDAWAHDELESSTPADGETLVVAPTAVTLIFSADLAPEFTQIAVTGDDGTSVASGAPVVVGAQVDQAVRVATSGTYTVAYRIVSSDGHPVQGQLGFVYNAPAPTATPSSPQPTVTESPTVPAGSAPATATLEPAASAGDSRSWWPLVVGGVVVLALLIVGVRRLMKSRRAGA